MSKKSLILTAAMAVAAAGMGVTSVAHADTETRWTGTTGEVRDGDARFKMRGRFQYDILSSDFEDAGEEGTRSYTRRAFLGFQGRFTEHWRYKVDFVLTPGSSTTSVDDAFLEYAGDSFSLIIGESNVTSPLEDRTSSLDIPFNERSSIVNAFGYGRAAGLGLVFGGANWSFAAAAQGDSLNSTSNSYSSNEGTSFSARGTWAPIYSQTPEGLTLLHLGAHVRQRDLNPAEDDSINSRPLGGRGAVILETGLDARRDTTWGVEVAGQMGPFGVQAEYMSMDVDVDDVGNISPTFDGYYVDLSWSLTGESRVYSASSGAFKGIKPANPVSEGGMGYWGLGLRYDSLDLSEGPVTATAGETDSYAVGLTWVPVSHVLFRLNWAHTEADYNSGGDSDADIVSLRTQFDF